MPQTLQTPRRRREFLTSFVARRRKSWWIAERARPWRAETRSKKRDHTRSLLSKSRTLLTPLAPCRPKKRRGKSSLAVLNERRIQSAPGSEKCGFRSTPTSPKIRWW